MLKAAEEKAARNKDKLKKDELLRQVCAYIASYLLRMRRDMIAAGSDEFMYVTYTFMYVCMYVYVCVHACVHICVECKYIRKNCMSYVTMYT